MQIPSPPLTVPGKPRLVADDAPLRELARRTMSERAKRREYLPSAAFDEVAWDFLLLLYAAGSELSTGVLTELVGTSDAAAQRWISFLADEGVATRTGADSVDLTVTGRRSMTRYFADIARERERQRLLFHSSDATDSSRARIGVRIAMLAAIALVAIGITYAGIKGSILMFAMFAGAAAFLALLTLFGLWALDNVPGAPGW